MKGGDFDGHVELDRVVVPGRVEEAGGSLRVVNKESFERCVVRGGVEHAVNGEFGGVWGREKYLEINGEKFL